MTLTSISTVQEAESIDAAVKGEGHYQIGTVSKQFKATRQGKEYVFRVGTTVGIRLSSGKTHYRLVSREFGFTKVFSTPISKQSRAFFAARVRWNAADSHTNAPGKVNPSALPETQLVAGINEDALIRILVKQILVPLIQHWQKDTKTEFPIALPSLRPWAYRVASTLSYAESLNLALARWYSNNHYDAGSFHLMREFTSRVFTLPAGPVFLYRGTKLKEDLKVGYVFKLETTLKKRFQSWSRSVKAIQSEFGSAPGAYILRGRIPSKIMVVSDQHWDQLFTLLDSKSFHQKLAGAIPKQLPTPLYQFFLTTVSVASPHLKIGELAKFRTKQLLALAEALTKDTLAWAISPVEEYMNEKEVIVDFTSKFKPACEIVFKKGGD